MFKLKKLNVVRVVETEAEKAAFARNGFKEIGETILDYAKMTVNDLKVAAKKKNIPGYSVMNKDDLINALTDDKKTSEKEDSKKESENK